MSVQYNDLEYDDYKDEQYGGPPFQFKFGATYDRPTLDNWSLALTGA